MRTPSALYSASASQISAKPASRAASKGSWNSQMPSPRLMVGPMYCSRPSVASDSRRAPAPNSSSGTAVTGPAAISQPISAASACASALRPW